MAQIYIPENQHQREQLQNGVSAPDVVPEGHAAIANAATTNHSATLLAGTLMMSAVVVVVNRLLWKRLYRLAERRYTLA